MLPAQYSGPRVGYSFDSSRNIASSSLSLSSASADVGRHFHKANASSIGGVGLYFVQNRQCQPVVQEVVRGGAAAQSGKVAVGDILTRVDGRRLDIRNGGIASIRDVISGPVNTPISLSFHATETGKQYTLTLVRQSPPKSNDESRQNRHATLQSWNQGGQQPALTFSSLPVKHYPSHHTSMSTPNSPPRMVSPMANGPMNPEANFFPNSNRPRTFNTDWTSNVRPLNPSDPAVVQATVSLYPERARSDSSSRLRQSGSALPTGRTRAPARFNSPAISPRAEGHQETGGHSSRLQIPPFTHRHDLQQDSMASVAKNMHPSIEAPSSTLLEAESGLSGHPSHSVNGVSSSKEVSKEEPGVSALRETGDTAHSAASAASGGSQNLRVTLSSLNPQDESVSHPFEVQHSQPIDTMDVRELMQSQSLPTEDISIPQPDAVEHGLNCPKSHIPVTAVTTHSTSVALNNPISNVSDQDDQIKRRARMLEHERAASNSPSELVSAPNPENAASANMIHNIPELLREMDQGDVQTDGQVFEDQFSYMDSAASVSAIAASQGSRSMHDDMLRKQMAELRDELDMKTGALARERQKAKTQQETVNNMRQSIRNYEMEIRVLQQISNAAKQDLETWKVEHPNAVNPPETKDAATLTAEDESLDWKRQFQLLKHEYDRKSLLIESLEVEVERLKEIVEDGKSINKPIPMEANEQREYAILQTKLRAHEASLEEARQETDSLQTSISNLHAQKKRLELVHSDSVRNLEDKEAELVSLQTEVLEVRSQNSLLWQQLREANDEYHGQKEISSKQAKDLKILHSQVSMLKESLEQNETKLRLALLTNVKTNKNSNQSILCCDADVQTDLNGASAACRKSLDELFGSPTTDGVVRSTSLNGFHSQESSAEPKSPTHSPSEILQKQDQIKFVDSRRVNGHAEGVPVADTSTSSHSTPNSSRTSPGVELMEQLSSLKRCLNDQQLENSRMQGEMMSLQATNSVLTKRLQQVANTVLPSSQKSYPETCIQESTSRSEMDAANAVCASDEDDGSIMSDSNNSGVALETIEETLSDGDSLPSADGQRPAVNSGSHMEDSFSFVTAIESATASRRGSGFSEITVQDHHQHEQTDLPHVVGPEISSSRRASRLHDVESEIADEVIGNSQLSPSIRPIDSPSLSSANGLPAVISTTSESPKNPTSFESNSERLIEGQPHDSFVLNENTSNQTSSQSHFTSARPSASPQKGESVQTTHAKAAKDSATLETLTRLASKGGGAVQWDYYN